MPSSRKISFLHGQGLDRVCRCVIDLDSSRGVYEQMSCSTLHQLNYHDVNSQPMSFPRACVNILSDPTQTTMMRGHKLRAFPHTFCQCVFCCVFFPSLFVMLSTPYDTVEGQGRWRGSDVQTRICLAVGPAVLPILSPHLWHAVV